jgi:hypothetical protein
VCPPAWRPKEMEERIVYVIIEITKESDKSSTREKNIWSCAVFMKQSRLKGRETGIITYWKVFSFVRKGIR